MFPTIQMTDLMQLVHVDELRWIDCRSDLKDPAYGHAAYLASHVPGAVRLDLAEDLSGPTGPHGGRHPLPSKEEWLETVQKCGIHPEDFIVIYDDDFTFAPRAWWLFKWIGHERVVVLEGGFSAYQQFDLPLTEAVPSYPSTDYRPDYQDQMIATVSDVSSVRETGVVLVDSRDADRYAGKNETIDPLPGHIPGAVNCPFKDAISPDGRLKDAEDLKEMYDGILDADSPILYCGSGVTACVNILALHSLGKTDVRLYPGSYSDWITYPEHPVE